MSEESLSSQYLRYIVDVGKHKRYGDIVPPEVDARINMEFGVIIPNKFDDYILMIWDIHDFCKSPERVFEFCKQKGIEPPPDGIIPLGPGRGSVGGSIVCYCIGIHECDPILFGLFFERFLNPERIAYPDIDYDISQRYRHIGIAYIADKYGIEHVSQIITFGTFSAKTILHDVLITANVPNSVITAVKETMPGSDEGLLLSEMEESSKFMEAMQAIEFPDVKVTITPQNAQQILRNNKLSPENVQEMMAILIGMKPSSEITVKSSWTWRKALDVMERLEGLSKTESTHAAGVVVAPVELESNVPLMKKDTDTNMVCQYDMRSLEEIGYLKMDALGLRTVDVNHEAEANVQKWYDKDFKLSNVRYDDTETINLINSGDTVGIFQIESSGFTQMMKDINIGGSEIPRKVVDVGEYWTELVRQISMFMWISAGLALYRPGPLDAVIEGKTMVQHLIDRKAGKEPVVYLFDEEKDYLEETYGVLVYQEQVMARVRQMTGCSLGRADILRKAMGKKDKVLMKAQMDWFTESAMEHQFSARDIPNKKQIVDRASEEISKFARYGFNKAHTVEYGHICYWNAYFKAHYPVAFYPALLNSLNDKPERQTIIIRDMLKHGIKLIPPTVNESEMDFTIVDESTVRFGLCAIKNVGQRAVDTIIADRAERGAYYSVEEFRIRIPATDCNVVGMENLAKCGAFDNLLGSKFDNRATLVASMRDICGAIKKITAKKPKKPAPTVDEALDKYATGCVSYEITKTAEDPIEYSIWEKEILKYYISAHPIDAYADEMVRWHSIGDVEQDDLPNGEFYIAGFIEGCHETIIKKEGRNKGKAMGFVTIGTQYRTYEATMFPGIYESCKPYIKNNNPVVLKGARNVYKDKVTIECKYIRNMTNSGIRDCPECHIRLNDDVSPLQMIQLKQIFNEHPGISKVYLHVIDGCHDMTIECNQCVAVNDHIIQFVDSIGNLSYKPN
jgi:DNA polymerase-3 subunit alpha